MTQRDRKPDTSLYHAAELAAKSLLKRLDRGRFFQPFFNLKVGQPYAVAEHASWDFCDMTGRFTDAWILARQMFDWPMTEEEEGVRKLLLAMQNPADGLFYDRKLSVDTTPLRPNRDVSWDTPELAEPDTADMFCQSRSLLGLVSLLLDSGSPDIQNRIERLITGLLNVSAKQDDFCYYPGHRYSPDGWQGVSAYVAKDLGHAALPAYGVCQLIPLVRYWEATSSPAAERLIQGLINFFVHQSTVVKEDGSFTGHLHSWGILPSTVGVLRYAMAKGDQEMISWSKRVYDFIVRNCSTFGWVPDGIGVDDGIPTGETCCITDLIHLGVKLAECGHTDSLDYVEVMLRNQLMESQVRKPDRFAFDPSAHAPDVRGMFYGAYDSWVMPNGLTGCSELGMEGCCTGSAVRAFYIAWKHAVVKRGSTINVDLMITRRSPWLDTMSYQPLAGRFSVLVRKPVDVAIRMPSWIDRQALTLAMNGTPIAPEWAGSYMRIAKPAPDSVIDLGFPTSERQTVEVIRDHRYALSWRGITLMKIDPPGNRYPIFRRTLEDMDLLNCFDLDRAHAQPRVEW